MDCGSLIVSTSLAGIGLIYFFYKRWFQNDTRNIYDKFGDTPKGMVILHAFPKMNFPSNIPAQQPWVLKIQLFCKMTKIPYIMDYEYPVGPRGKSPWISVHGGQHVGDSDLILNFLQKEFKVSDQVIKGSYNESELAMARAVRVMLEERFFWALPLWRFVWPNLQGSSLNPFSIFRVDYGKIYQKSAWGHGIGRHSKEDALKMFAGDLDTVSNILGNKKFILGDVPCIEDCAIFGMLAQAVYGLVESPFEKLIIEKLPNLKSYVDRTRKEYFPDWVVPVVMDSA